LQVGLRRAEIAALTVGDLLQNRGCDSLRVMRKGGRRDTLAINPQTAARLRAYLDKAGHMTGVEGPLFRPLKHNGKRHDERRGMDPDAIDRVVRKYAGAHLVGAR
jgi:integrase